MKTEFLDLGIQPIANNFLSHLSDSADEYTYRLRVIFDDETKLVSLNQFVPPELMFNDSYVYHSSMSRTMTDHFSSAAQKFHQEFETQSVLEIGSNDGVFLRYFPSDDTIAVEPSANFAEITNDMGYTTYNDFWDKDLATLILNSHGSRDFVYAANCVCHIQDLDVAFCAIADVIAEEGIFVFEDPSLLKMIERCSYDQIYDEHAHIFSVSALQNLLNKNGLEIFRVEELEVHGGSNRIYASLKGRRSVEPSVSFHLERERIAGLNELTTYTKFATMVQQSKKQLVDLLRELKRKGYKIISYGATSKSTTVFNYCGITTDIIDYIIDTTPSKQGKFSPGSHIPVLCPAEGLDESVDYAFLGAWNYEKEILNKEEEFIKRGRFISHIPFVRFI